MLDIKDITNKIIQGDCLKVMKQMPDNCVDLTVTSPPYDNLRDYEGFVFNFEGIAQQLYRVTKTGGVVVWVVGDATIDGSETGTSFRQALYFKELGFNLHDTMIYQVPGAGAKGSNKCYWQVFEYMFVFTKGKISTVNRIKDKKNIKRGTKCTSNKQARDGVGTRLHPKEGTVVGKFGYRDNVWVVPSGNGHGDYTGHPAPFPEKLAKDHIISWSNENDLILDPFTGSGTTAKMASLMNRNYIGIEISPEYCEIARKRVQEAKDSMGLFK